MSFKLECLRFFGVGWVEGKLGEYFGFEQVIVFQLFVKGGLGFVRKNRRFDKINRRFFGINRRFISKNLRLFSKKRRLFSRRCRFASMKLTVFSPERQSVLRKARLCSPNRRKTCSKLRFNNSVRPIAKIRDRVVICAIANCLQLCAA